MHTQLYFAYGMNMGDSHMMVVCEEAERAGTARLPGHRFSISGTGGATLLPEEGAEVWGVLWCLNARDEKILDAHEMVHLGTYDRRFVEVETGAGETLKALTYSAADPTPGAPREGYAEGVAAIGKWNSLPEAYFEEVLAWRGTGVTAPPHVMSKEKNTT